MIPQSDDLLTHPPHIFNQCQVGETCLPGTVRPDPRLLSDCENKYFRYTFFIKKSTQIRVKETSQPSKPTNDPPPTIHTFTADQMATTITIMCVAATNPMPGSSSSIARQLTFQSFIYV